MLSAWEQHLSGHYPDPKKWMHGFKNISEQEFRRFANLWLSEGIPFAFQAQPMIYEKARELLLTKLDCINEGHLGVTGSAQLGFSLSPHKFAREFIIGISDLDAWLISPKWFALLEKDIKNAEDEKFGIAKKPELSGNIERGFIDHKKIPGNEESAFPNAYKMSIVIINFQHNLEAMCKGKRFKEVSLRVYKDKSAKLRQQTINLINAYSYAKSEKP